MKKPDISDSPAETSALDKLKQLADIAERSNNSLFRSDVQAEASALVERMTQRHKKELAALLPPSERTNAKGADDERSEEALARARMEQAALDGKSRLFLLRLNTGLSQRKAAKQLGIPSNRFQRLEAGLQEPYATELPVFAGFYGISLRDLVELYAGMTLDQVDVGNDDEDEMQVPSEDKAQRAETPLAALRYRKGAGQRRAARALHLNKTKMQLLECGTQEPTCIEMLRFAKYYGVSVEEIVSDCASMSQRKGD